MKLSEFRVIPNVWEVFFHYVIVVLNITIDFMKSVCPTPHGWLLLVTWWHFWDILILSTYHGAKKVIFKLQMPCNNFNLFFFNPLPFLLPLSHILNQDIHKIYKCKNEIRLFCSQQNRVNCSCNYKCLGVSFVLYNSTWNCKERI